MLGEVDIPVEREKKNLDLIILLKSSIYGSSWKLFSVKADIPIARVKAWGQWWW